MELPIIVVGAGQRAKLSLFDREGKETIILDISPTLYADDSHTEINQNNFYIICNWFISTKEMQKHYERYWKEDENLT